MRISRPCYDKYRRCPGWVGGGMKCAKVERCDGGCIQVDYDDTWWAWKFWPCDTCNVLVLPYHSKKLSIPWLIYIFKWKISYHYDEWTWKRRNRRRDR